MNIDRFIVGLDIGQSRDYTALVVLQVDPMNVKRFRLVNMQRVRELLFPQVADWVGERLDNLSTHGHYDLIVDATGVGPAVTDLLIERGRPFKGVKIHGGDHEKFLDGYYRIPKRNLVNNLQVLFHSGRLRIQRNLKHATTLRDELITFKMKVNTVTAHDSYSAWREGEHDDLVLATALAAWGASRFGGGVHSNSMFSGPFGGAGFAKPEDLPFSA